MSETDEEAKVDLGYNEWLPEGIHDMPLGEIGERFGGPQGCEQRPNLFRRFEEYVVNVVKLDGFVCLLIDGSFVTDKQRPSDIDVIVVVTATKVDDDAWLPFEYNLVKAKRARRLYGVDARVVRDGSPEYASWVKYFSNIVGLPDARKGLVRLVT
jgi:predicted nucleotidyltransferase